MRWIIDYWVPTLTPEYVRPPVEKPSLQLLANPTANHFSHIQVYISNFILLKKAVV